MSKPEIVRRSDLSSLTCVSWKQMTSMWWISASDWMMRRFAADNSSTLSCIIRRAGPTAWKPRSALSEGFLLALWPGSIRIWSAGGIWFPSAGVFCRGTRREGDEDVDYLHPKTHFNIMKHHIAKWDTQFYSHNCLSLKVEKYDKMLRN